MSNQFPLSSSTSHVDFQRVFEAMPGIGALLLPDPPSFTIVAVTDEFLKVSGMTRKQLVGRPLFDPFPANPDGGGEDSTTIVLESLNSVLSTARPHQIASLRYDLVGDAGAYTARYWQVSNKPVLDSDGNVGFIIHCPVDITEKVLANRQTEKAKAMERDNKLFMQAPIAICILRGPENIIELANEPAMFLWGRADHVVGKPLFEVLPELDTRKLRSMLQDVLRTKKTYHGYERRFVLKKDNRTVVKYLNFALQPYFDEDQVNPGGVMVVANEVTERIRIRRELEENRKSLELAIEVGGLGVFNVDLHTGSATYSRHVMEWFGLERQHTLFQDVLSKIFPEDRTVVTRAIDDSIAGRGKHDITYRVASPADGELRYLRSIGEVKIEKGKPQFFSGIIQDVSAQVKARATIERSVTEWIHLSNAMPQLVWIAQANGEVTHYNNRVAEFAGAKQLPSGKWEWDGLLHPDDWSVTTEAWKRAVAQGTMYEIGHRVRMKDGSYRWHLSRAFPQKDDQGNVVKWYGTATDIHQQKQFEEELREKEERLSGIFHQSAVGIAQCNLDGKIILVNDRYCEITGRTREELYQLTFFDITHPDDIPNNMALLESAIRKGIPFKLDKRYVRPDNSVVWVHMDVSAISDANGAPRYLLGVANDITERRQAENALKESEERFRIMADAAPNMVWALNPDGSVKYVNKYTRKYMGLKDGEWPDNFSQFIHPDDLASTASKMLAAIGKREPFTGEARFRHYTGEFRWMLMQGAPSYYPDGRLYGYIGTAIDIDDRRRVEEELKYQHLLIKAITDNATDPLFMIDKRGVCTFLNPAAEKLFGYTLSDMQDKPLHDYVHYARPDGTPFPFHECPIGHAVFGNKELKGQEDVFIARDGTRIPVKCSAKTILMDGNIIGILLEVRDITEEKRADQALRESEERFRTMADNISQLAWMADATGDIFWYNKRWFDFTGSTIEEMKGSGWKKVHHPDYVQPVSDKFFRSMRNGLEWEDTFPLRGKEGNFRWFLSRAIPIRGADGSVLRWFGTNTDITERMEAEEAIKVMANNLEKLVEVRTIALQRSNEDLQQFAHVASHDLKEPLRKIKTFSNRLEEEYFNELGQRGKLYIEKIVSATERMFRMIEGVLDYSTVNSTGDKKASVNLNDIIRNIEMDLEVIIHEKSAVVRHDELPVIEGATVLLYQLFYNLINNSLKFSRQDVSPVITISATMIMNDDTGKEETIIVLQDNGIGFEQEYAERIFHTFTRLNSKDKFEGTGLGLALCKKIVEFHSGTIEAKGIRGEGATFYITLPVKQN
jgi:PAS domain S-box-containing protein